MKASKLIAILAEHLAENGDFDVFISPSDPDQQYREITNCWYNYGQTWDAEDRIIISGRLTP